MTPPRHAQARQHGCPHDECRQRYLTEGALLDHLETVHGESLRERYTTGTEVADGD